MALRSITAAAAALVIVVGLATDARADIIFSTNQGSLQPAEELLFSAATAGNPVQGQTNNTATLFDIYSNEQLSAQGGQARVGAVDGSYNLFFITAHDPAVVFNEFKANVRIDSRASGVATVTACGEDGNFDGANFTPLNVNVGDGQPCEAFNYNLASGENFFVLSVTGSQLLTGVRISTNVGIVDIRQIRLSPVTREEESSEVPEPALLALMGGGLLAAARVSRRRRSAAVTQTV